MTGVTACKWDTPLPLEPLWKELKRVVKPRAAIVMTATQPFTSRLVSSNYEMFRYEWIWLKSHATRFLDSHRMPMLEHESILIFADSLPKYYPQITKKPIENIRPHIRTDRKKGAYLSGDYSYDYTRKISINQRMPRTVVKFNNAASEGNILHPTQKPVALFEYLIKTYTQENEIVLDFVAGSGTTAIAARKTNRQFICGDNLLEYVEIARQRLQNSDPYQSTIHDNGMKQLSLFESA